MCGADDSGSARQDASIPAVHHLAAGAGDHGGKHRVGQRLAEEAHEAAGEQAVGTARVHAVHLPLVRAVDGALPAAGCVPVVARPVDPHVLVPVGPDAAVDAAGSAAPAGVVFGDGGRDLRPPLPQLLAVRALGHHRGVRQSVRDVRPPVAAAVEDSADIERGRQAEERAVDAAERAVIPPTPLDPGHGPADRWHQHFGEHRLTAHGGRTLVDFDRGLDRVTVERVEPRHVEANLAEQVVLLDVRQQPHRPRVARAGVADSAEVHRELAVGALEVVQPEAELLQVVLALHPGRRLPHLLHGGEQQADQDGDDGDHHQQFDQGEPGAGRSVSHRCGLSGYQGLSFRSKSTVCTPGRTATLRCGVWVASE